MPNQRTGRYLRALLGVFGVFGFAAPVLGADGSWTGNPALLRGGYEASPPQRQISVQPRSVPQTQPVPAQANTTPLLPSSNGLPGNCQELIEMGIVTRECLPGYYPASQTAPAQTAPAQASSPQQIYAPRAANQPQPTPPVMQAQTSPNQADRQIYAPPVDAMTTSSVDPTTTSGIGVQLPTVRISDDNWTAEWNLGLSGALVNNANGWRFDTSFLPSASLTRAGRRGDLNITADGEATAVSTGVFRLDQVRLGLSGSYALNRDSVFSGSGEFSMTQEGADAALLDPTIASAPVITNGNVQLGVAHQLSRGAVEVAVSGYRESAGDTGLAGGGTRANPEQARTGLGLGVRGGIRITPRVTLFTDLQIDREFYDNVNAGFGAKQDNWTYSGVVGLSANWGDRIAAEISAGYAHRQFDSPLITSTGGYILGGSLSFALRNGSNVTATIDNSLDPPAANVAGASTRFGHAASLSVQYQINDWLTTTASAGGSYAWYAASAETEMGLSAGLGASFAINRYLSLGLGYRYNWAQSTTNGVSDSHRVSVSTTLSR
jgi:hypothetical protein